MERKLRALLVDFDHSTLPFSENIIYMGMKSDADTVLTPQESYFMVRKIVSNSDVLVINMKKYSQDVSVITHLAYSITTPIIGVGASDIGVFSNLFISHLFGDINEAIQYLHNNYI